MNETTHITRKEQAVQTKHKIFQSAYKLFAEKGFDHVSIEMITKDAGVAKGSFYVHFKSKKALISDLADFKVKEIDFDYGSFFSSIDEKMSATQMLLLLSEKVSDVMINVLGYSQLSIMYETLLEKKENISHVTSYSRHIYAILRQIIETGMDTGEFQSDLSVDDLSKHLLLSLRGLTFQWCVMYPDFDLKKTTQEYMLLMINGLKNKDSAIQ